MSYTVKVDQQATKDLKPLDRQTVKRIYERLEELALEPYSPRLSKALKMLPGKRSSRVGGWRILYEVSDAESTVMVTAIRPRKNAY